MKHLRRPLALLLLLTLYLTALAGCGAKELRQPRETGVYSLAYGADGTPTISLKVPPPLTEGSALAHGFNQGTIVSAARPFSELMDAMAARKNRSSLYLLQIKRVLSKEEAEKLDGYLTAMELYGGFLLFEAVVVYDYLRDEPCDRTVILWVSGNDKWQFRGMPPYRPGDCEVTFLEPAVDGAGFFTPIGRGLRAFDKIINNDTYLYANRPQISTGIDDISLPMSDEERTRASAYKNNPISLMQKFRLGDIVGRIKAELESRDYEMSE